jgi:hypothetical protein
MNYRPVVLSMFLVALFFGSTAIAFQQASFCDRIKPCEMLPQSEAEKLLGQPARLIMNTSERRGDVRQCMCGYKGVSVDKDSGQDCALYFSLEQKEENPSAQLAHQVIISTKEANFHDSFVSDLKGIGDEAFLLGNDPYSHLIMARKGVVVLRLQVKHSTREKSADDLRAFAEKVFKQI